MYHYAIYLNGLSSLRKVFLVKWYSKLHFPNFLLFVRLFIINLYKAYVCKSENIVMFEIIFEGDKEGQVHTDTAQRNGEKNGFGRCRLLFYLF